MERNLFTSPAAERQRLTLRIANMVWLMALLINLGVGGIGESATAELPAFFAWVNDNQTCVLALGGVGYAAVMLIMQLIGLFSPPLSDEGDEKRVARGDAAFLAGELLFLALSFFLVLRLWLVGAAVMLVCAAVYIAVRRRRRSAGRGNGAA